MLLLKFGALCLLMSAISGVFVILCLIEKLLIKLGIVEEEN